MQERFTERRFISVSPTLSLGAYSQFDSVGGLMTFPAAASTDRYTGAVVSVRIFDKDSEATPYELFLFNADPSASTFTDNAGITIADADLDKIFGVVQFATTTRFAFANNSFSEVNGLYLPFNTVPGTNALYGALRTGTSGTPTYTATSDITVELVVEVN